MRIHTFACEEDELDEARLKPWQVLRWAALFIAILAGACGVVYWFII